MGRCIDARGASYVSGMFDEIAAALGRSNVHEAIAWLENLLADLQISRPELMRKQDIPALAVAVNPARLRNNPVCMDHDVAASLYRTMC